MEKVKYITLYYGNDKVNGRPYYPIQTEGNQKLDNKMISLYRNDSERKYDYRPCSQQTLKSNITHSYLISKEKRFSCEDCNNYQT